MNENTTLQLHRNSLKFNTNAFGGEPMFISIIQELQSQPSIVDLLRTEEKRYELTHATLSWNLRLEPPDLAVLLVFLLDRDHSELSQIGDEEWKIASTRLNRVEFELTSKTQPALTRCFGIFEFFYNNPVERMMRFNDTFLTLFVLSPFISRLILQQPADAESVTKIIRERDLNGLQIWLDKYPNRLDDQGDFSNPNPLCFAAEENWTEGASFLIYNGAVVNIRDYRNATPLLYSLRNQNHQLTQLLLQAGANPLLGEWGMVIYGLNKRAMSEQEYLSFIETVRTTG